MKLLFLINTQSGTGKGSALFRALEIYRQNHPEIEVLSIDWSKIEDLKHYCSSFERIIIASGDGTASSLLRILSPLDIPIGIYPLGTGNDLAREFGFNYQVMSMLPIHKVVGIYQSAAITNLTIWGLYNNDTLVSTFTNYFSLGYTAHIIGAFDKIRKNNLLTKTFGRYGNLLTYSLLSQRYFFSKRIKNILITNNTGLALKTDSACILFTNIASFGGIGCSQKASDPEDEFIELSLSRSALLYMKTLLPRKWWGSGLALTGQASEWKLLNLSPGLISQIDGEVFQLSSQELTIKSFRKQKFLKLSQLF